MNTTLNYELERERILKPGWFYGEENKRRQSVVDAGLHKRDPADKPQRRHSNLRKDTLVALQLQAMPEYKPHFINWLTAIQVCIVLGLCAHAYTTEDAITGKIQFAEIGINFSRELCDPYSAGIEGAQVCPTDFNGDYDTKRKEIEELNWTIGPTLTYLVQAGAKIAVCMRESALLSAIYREEEVRECTNYYNTPPGENLAGRSCQSVTGGVVYPDPMACCETSTGGRKGMTTYRDCKAWRDLPPPSDSDPKCPSSNKKCMNPSQRDQLTTVDDSYCAAKPTVACSVLCDDGLNNCQGTASHQCTAEEGVCVGRLKDGVSGAVVWDAAVQCNEDQDQLVLRPCCGTTDGKCELLTATQCRFKGGVTHSGSSFKGLLTATTATVALNSNSSYPPPWLSVSCVPTLSDGHFTLTNRGAISRNNALLRYYVPRRHLSYFDRPIHGRCY